MYAKRSEWHLVVKGFFAGQALPMITSWGGTAGAKISSCCQTGWSVSPTRWLRLASHENQATIASPDRQFIAWSSGCSGTSDCTSCSRYG